MTRLMHALLLSSCLVLVALVQGAPIGSVYHANVTVFSTNALRGATTGGSCGYGSLNPSGAIGATANDNPVVAGLPQSGCGSCVRITCDTSASPDCKPGAQPVTVTIIDSCPGCSFNIPVPLFTTLADPRFGVLPVAYQQVDCNWAGSITIRVLEFRTVNASYLKLILFNVAGPATIRAVAVKSTGASDDTYVPLMNNYGAVWEGKALPPAPLDVQVTNGAGTTLVAGNAIKDSAQGDVPTSVQFVVAS
ncbi:hypothetical protein WJX81_001771 [Elliptochloris bilobata]|uniref:Expansin-like EG45 domain-containing protein n=1 Tax=Elliptochloris bilobata TaxID=381761 RepID=A0AAW1SDG2_9CHLO